MAIRQDLIYKNECYRIMELIFEVFNNVGYGHKEKFYQNALAETFNKNKIVFKREVKARVKYKGREIGFYMFDFLIFDKIIIEIKQKIIFQKKI